MSIKYYQTIFSFQISHYTWYTILRWYTYKHMYIWSGHSSASIISIPFCSHNLININPISFLIYPYICILLYFGANTKWYLQFHVLCAKLLLSFMTNPPFWFYLRLATTILYQKGVFFPPIAINFLNPIYNMGFSLYK